MSEAPLLEDVARGWCRAGGIRFRARLWPECIGRVRSRAVAYLNPDFAQAIHHLKYRRRKKVAKPLGRWMSRVVLSDPGFRSCEGLVAVPLRPEKVRERGYNPAELLADAVAKRTGIRVVSRVLVKTRATPSQTGLEPEQRIANPRGSFAVRDSGSVSGKRLVLVDDVLTSGSTAAAAAAALLGAGAAEVRVLTAARTPLRRGPDPASEMEDG